MKGKCLILALALVSMNNMEAQELYADSTDVFMDSTAVCTDSLTVELPESMAFTSFLRSPFNFRKTELMAL